MAATTIPSATPAAPSEKYAFLRVALLMIGTVTALTLTGMFSAEKTSFLYKDQLHLDASAVATLGIFLAIPNYLRPLIGAASDMFPLFGSHRRSYYVIALLLCAAGFFSLSLLRHYSYLNTALLIAVTGLGSVTLLIMADAVMVAIGNATGTVGRLQAIQQFTPILLAILFTAHFGGYVTQHWSYAHCFRAAALTALLALPLAWLIDERRAVTVGRDTSPEGHAARRAASQAERARVLAALRGAAASPGLWAIVGFIFYLIITPGTNTAMFYYGVDHLHFSKQILGNLGQYAAPGGALGILVFAALSRKLPMRALVWGAWLIDCATYLLYMGYHDLTSAHWIVFISAFLGIIYTLGLLTLAARACPPGVEGTVYGLVISAIGLGGSLGEKIGSSIYDGFGPANHHSVAHGWFALLWFGFGFTLLAVVFIPFLPTWARSKIITPPVDKSPPTVE